LGFIRGTTTGTGLVVTAEGWERPCRKGIAVSDADMQELDIERHDTCLRWNYTVNPRNRYRWN
jgi:hypothetical protein